MSNVTFDESITFEDRSGGVRVAVFDDGAVQFQLIGHGATRRDLTVDDLHALLGLVGAAEDSTE